MAREKTRRWKVRMVASFQVIDHLRSLPLSDGHIGKTEWMRV